MHVRENNMKGDGVLVICAPKTKQPHAACWRWLPISSCGRCGASVGAGALLYLQILREDVYLILHEWIRWDWFWLKTFRLVDVNLGSLLSNLLFLNLCVSIYYFVVHSVAR